MKPTTRRRLLRIAYTLRWRLMDLIKFQSSSAQVFLLVQRHTHTHKHTKLVLHTYLRPTCILICPALRPSHTSAANGNNCSTHSHTHTHTKHLRGHAHTHIYLYMYVFMGRICAISCALFAGRKRIMAPTNCAELKRKMCRPAGRPQAVNVTHTLAHPSHNAYACMHVCAATTCVNNLRRVIYVYDYVADGSIRFRF